MIKGQRHLWKEKAYGHKWSVIIIQSLTRVKKTTRLSFINTPLNKNTCFLWYIQCSEPLTRNESDISDHTTTCYELNAQLCPWAATENHSSCHRPICFINGSSEVNDKNNEPGNACSRKASVENAAQLDKKIIWKIKTKKLPLMYPIRYWNAGVEETLTVFNQGTSGGARAGL